MDSFKYTFAPGAGLKPLDVILPSGPFTAKCRGGPYHGRLMTESHPWPAVRANKIKWNPHNIPPYTEQEYFHYLLVDNPETMKKEWIWEPHLKKLKKRWQKKQEIEQIMKRFYSDYAFQGNFKAQRDIQRVLELVYKL